MLAPDHGVRSDHYVIANLHPLTRQTIHNDTAFERDSVSEPDHSCVAPRNSRRYKTLHSRCRRSILLRFPRTSHSSRRSATDTSGPRGIS